MYSVKLITLVLSMAALSHGKAVQQQCNSCCPTPTPPDEDAITCDKLSEHLGMLDDALAEGSCDEVEGQQSDAVCNAFTKAIPPCMVLKGGSKQGECLAEKASELGDEEIATNCKCKAFRNIRDTVGSVKNMMCVDSRESRNFGYGYGMNTIWFQYLLCKDMSFACYFFTQGWNQGDFGQYYLYDNLLDSSSGLTDDALLTLAVVGGGLGGGYRPRYAPAHGHYYPTTPEPEPETEPEPLHRRRRSGILSTPNTDEPSTASASRRRRQATSTDESSTGSASRRRRATPTEPSTSSASRRRRATPTNDEPSTSSASRRRRATPNETSTASASRRRRQATPYDESSTGSASRRRRATPTEPSTASASRRRRDTPATPTTEPFSSRRRRSTPTTEAPTNSRRRRATPACCDLEGDEVCEIDQDLC